MNRFSVDSRAWRSVRVAGDVVAAAAAFYCSFLLRFHLPLPFTGELLPRDRFRFFTGEWGVVLVSQLLLLYFFGFYDSPETRPRLEQVRHLLTAAGFQGLALMGYYFLANRTFPRSVLLLFVLLDFLLILGWRLVLSRHYRPAPRRVAIVGCGAPAFEIAQKINLYAGQGLSVAGFVPAPDEPESAAAELPRALGRCLGSVDDLPDLLARGEVDDIILAASAHPWRTHLLDRLAGMRPDHSNVLLLPGPFESLIGRTRYRWVQDVPLIEVVQQTDWRINGPLKRAIDLTVGLVLLLLTLPLLLLCALAVRLTSPGPIFYRQVRLGRGQQPFTLWKLRTMRRDAEADGDEVLAQPEDRRLTPVGSLLRRFRLDELPQLANVLAGRMSLVGPRPERPGFARRFVKQVPGYAERFALLPGLTGLAQVNGDYQSTPENKLRYDLAYMANWSLWLDLAILFRTIKIVMTSRGT